MSYNRCALLTGLAATLLAPRRARAASGHAAAAPPTSVMTSRRFMSNIESFPPPASAGVSLASGCQPGTAVSLGRNVYPQKHDQEDQDRIHHDPHDVGSPTPSLLYSLLAHGGFSLGSQCMGPPPF